MHRQVEWHCSAWPLRTPRRRVHRRGRRHQRTARQRTNSSPSPTFPRKFADVDWGSRKIIPNKKCAECWPGAAFGPYWLLTERLRYETTPLLPALRDRVHVHGRRDDAHGGHRRSHAASGNSRAAGASREVELSVAFECRKTSPNAAASGPLGRSHLGLMSTKLALAVG